MRLKCSALPTAGNWLAIECSSVAWVCGWPESAKPTIVANTSSSGNSEKKP